MNVFEWIFYDSTCWKTQSEESVRTGIELLDPVPDVFSSPFADMVIIIQYDELHGFICVWEKQTDK